MALVRAWYDCEPEETQWKRCLRLLETTSKKVVRVRSMKDAVSQLAAEGEAEFEQLHDLLEHEQAEAFIRSRFGKTKAAPEHYAPEALKGLRPPMEGCVLSLQVEKHCFAAYYPRLLTQEQLDSKRKYKRSWSTARSFLDKRARLQALTEVVNFLWDHHWKRELVRASVVKDSLFSCGLNAPGKHSCMLLAVLETALRTCHRGPTKPPSRLPWTQLSQSRRSTRLPKQMMARRR